MVRSYHILIWVWILLCISGSHEARSYQGHVVLESPPRYVLNIISDLGSYLKQRYNTEPRNGFSDSQEEDSDSRGIDFGLGRGYSGSQAARHMLGLQQVNFAGGPGKRRRRKRSREPLLIAVEAEQ